MPFYTYFFVLMLQDKGIDAGNAVQKRQRLIIGQQQLQRTVVQRFTSRNEDKNWTSVND